MQSRVVATSPDPAAAARAVAEFNAQHPEAAQRLLSSAAGLTAFVAIAAHSRFMTEELMRHPEWLEEALQGPDLHRPPSPEDLKERLQREESLALFRRRELLRVMVRDVLGYATLAEVTEEISNIADAILDAAYRRAYAAAADRYGAEPDGAFSVVALGKLGGRELNYSSDIDLMFVFSGSGEGVSAFFKRVAQSLTDSLATYSAHGVCYRVDLRLRPDGTLGEVAISTEAAKRYYENRARDWELQMLIKARVAAGDLEPGRELLESVEPRIYSSTLDFSAVEAVSQTRERIHEKLTARRRAADSGLDIKLARGGIRDIEFLVQCLQRLHGGREPWLRNAGTLLALSRLNDKKLISGSEFSRLACAYEFLRHLEHRLQMAEDRQTHTLPSDKSELEILARRMPLRELGRAPSADKLLHQLNLHLEEVQQLYDRVIHSQQPLYYSHPPPKPEVAEPRSVYEPAPPSNLIRFLDQRAPGIASVLAGRPLRHGARAFEAFLESVFEDNERLRAMNDDPQLTADILDIFDLSPWFSEALVRRPALLDQVRTQAVPAAASQITDVNSLRRFFGREMLRIQARSICGPVPIFDTLAQMSDLADAVICTAYRLALDEVRQAHPPLNAAYDPGDRMMVIALGRLGMREFDLGSDADLNFVLPDEDAGELRFWTRVAERMINVISAYTGEGVMFTVDTRLRPNGREGTLVQTVATYKDYLAARAEAWEGITYMKSRCVAGDAQKSIEFLHELQDVDWRRYGQGGRSRTELRAMRARLEREAGADNPLKAGVGGYYDIDFALMFLRLKGAGIFYKVLNTPERIAIVEQSGLLDRKDAAMLEDAATLYRAIDHGLRVYSGQAEGRMPHSPAHLETLSALVRRWTPDHLHDQPLTVELQQIQAATREYFKRLFG